MIAQIMLEQFQKEEAPKKSNSQYYRTSSSELNSIRVIKEAPILILCFREYDKDWTEGDYLSIGAAIENLCLRATDLGLATLWIRDVIFAKNDIRDKLTNKNMELVSGVSVGYSTEYPYPRKKKDLKEIIRWL